MNTTTLQIPMTKQLKTKAGDAAAKQGFSSLQEIVRVFLSQLAANKVGVAFNIPSVELSLKNDDCYAKMIQEVATGRVKTKKFGDIEKITAYLNE